LLVIDDKILGYAVPDGVASHNLAAKTVEGGNRSFIEHRKLALNVTIVPEGEQVVVNSLLHLPGRLAGERERKNLIDIGLALQDKAKKAVTEYGGFP